MNYSIWQFENFTRVKIVQKCAQKMIAYRKYFFYGIFKGANKKSHRCWRWLSFVLGPTRGPNAVPFVPALNAETISCLL